MKHVGIFADGVAVKKIGSKTFKLTKNIVDSSITVTTDEICSAIKELYDETRVIAEPAGALSWQEQENISCLIKSRIKILPQFYVALI